MGDEFFDVGSDLSVPGIEARMEYGDASTMRFDRIPRALLINEQALLEKVRLTQVDGLHDDPEGRETRQVNADQHGETAGNMLYAGRTVGLTGRVEAGSIATMRDWWGKLRACFGTGERELLVHPRFEVPLYVNEVLNPDFEFGAAHWTMLATSGTSAITRVDEPPPAGSFANGSATGAGSFSAVPTELVVWSGEDIWVTASVKAQGGTIASFTVGAISALPGGSLVSGVTMSTVATQSSPTAGSYYVLSVRIPASSIPRDTGLVGLQVKATVSGSGSYTMRVKRACLALLDPAQESPAGFFSAIMPGFEPEGVRGASRSIGPCYASNQIEHPLCETTDGWTEDNSSGVTRNLWSSSKAWAGGDAPQSIFYDATANASGKRIALKTVESIVAPGRSYRFYALVKVEAINTAFLDVDIIWLDQVGAEISRSSASFPVAGGTVVDVAMGGDAPARALAASVEVGMLSHLTTAGSQGIKFFLTDPCLVDTSSWTPGRFVGLGDPQDEVSFPGGARRRIPRPFMLLRARKTSDMKAPEQQNSRSAWRDFSMSVRAADPRLYVLDRRRRQTQLVGTSTFVSVQSPAGFTLETATLPVPAGYTYEGHFIANPGGSPFVWSTDAYTVPFGSVPHPLGGVGMKGWDLGGEFGANRPTSDLNTRVYRSAEGFTYDNPRVILGGAPSGFGGPGIGAGFDSGQFVYQIDTVGSPDTYKWNYLALLLKRVSSGTWLELRWTSMSHVGSFNLGLTDNANAPYAFELWCSHNASGSSGATRLAQWDYASYDSSNGRYPFRPSVDPMWVTSWMDSNVVHWELWSAYPSPVDLSHRVETGSFTLPAPVITLLGSAVAGSCGWSTSVSRAFDQDTFNQLMSTPPFVHYFESSDVAQSPVSVTIPVIGSIDTPQVIQLRGDMIEPVVSISVPALDDLPARTSVARFSGTVLEANPITIDLAPDGDGVADSLGNNAIGSLLPGSDFAVLRPGLNYITIQAKGWGSSYPAHVVTSWRDALR